MRALKWAAMALCVMAGVYVVWAALYLVGFVYASSKFEQVTTKDTRSSVEERNGLLFSRQVNRDFLGNYQFVFEEAVSDPNNTLVFYGLFGAGFTVIYNGEGNVVAHIDNGLDG